MDTSGAIASHSWAEAWKRLPLYLGSGHFGGCFDPWGLQAPGHPSATPCHLMHSSHYEGDSRGGYGAFVPVGNVHWALSGIKPHPLSYSQRFSPQDGILLTDWQSEDWGYSLKTIFSPDCPDVLALDIEWRNDCGHMPQLHWHFPEKQKHAAMDMPPDCFVTAGCVGCLHYSTLDGSALEVSDMADGVCMVFPQGTGRSVVFLQIRAADSGGGDLPCPANFYKTAVAAWRSRNPRLPSANGFSKWHGRLARYAYHLLASFSPDAQCPAPPCGWSGIGWKTAFPMDLSFIHPAIIQMDRADIPQAWSRFFVSRIPQMQAFTREVFRRKGCNWAWEFPPGDQPLVEPVPNRCFYELHNAAYPAKIACDVTEVIHDNDFEREIAWPLVCESARFLADCLVRCPDGLHDIMHDRFSGQDEAAGEGGGNYLCALFAVSWTLRKAVELAQHLNLENDETARWRQILKQGLGFSHLLDSEVGIYSVCNRFTAKERLGLQKHPVQLNPLWSLPRPLEPPDRRAWELRHDLCTANGGCGWTRPVFLLAAANLGDEAAFEQELQGLENVGLIDDDALQIDEAPPDYMARMEWTRTSYYLTNEAMVLNAFFIRDNSLNKKK